MTKIYDNLYQFTDILEPIKLSMHQYLLLGNEPVLIQTGTVNSARKNIPLIKELLGEKKLKYVLVSHFESDECGGLSVIHQEYPEAQVVCSESTSRQFFGFGITYNVQILKGNENFSTKDFNFKAISYPSDMHLWEGLLFYETKNEIFFANDLIFEMGETHGKIITKNWNDILQNDCKNALPVSTLQEKLINDLMLISPKFIATGHSSCINVTV